MRQTKILGMINLTMILSAVIWPPIHNIVVVTSPKGDHAPPAFAAIIIAPAKYNLSFLSGINLPHKEVITMAVVRLSSSEERKKVIMVMMIRSLLLLVVVSLS